jgi:hypothetical protein
MEGQPVVVACRLLPITEGIVVAVSTSALIAQQHLKHAWPTGMSNAAAYNLEFLPACLT